MLKLLGLQNVAQAETALCLTEGLIGMAITHEDKNKHNPNKIFIFHS